MWRTLEAVDDDALERIAVARAEARAKAWAVGADPGFYVVDVDATLVTSHSDKEGAAPNYKRGFGFYPLLAFLDATGEALAGILRPGNAGSNTAEDHVALLGMARWPSSPSTRTRPRWWSGPTRARCRTASSTPVGRRARASRSGFDLTEPVRRTCLAFPSGAGCRR